MAWARTQRLRGRQHSQKCLGFGAEVLSSETFWRFLAEVGLRYPQICRKHHIPGPALAETCPNGAMRTPDPLPMSIANVPFTLDSALRYGVSVRRTRASDLRIPSRSIRVPKNADFTLFDSCRALTAATPHAVITHLTAARLYGFYLPWRFREQGEFDLAKWAGQARPRRKNVHGREMKWNPRDIGELAGVPITSEQRTLLDIAPLLSVDELVAIADQLVCEHHRSFGYQKYPTVSLATLRTYIAQNRNHRGVRKLDEAIKLVEVGSDSPKETELRLLIGRWQLPLFSHNVEIRNPAGEGKVGPDLACEEYKTCAEYDGEHHFSGLAPDTDQQ